MTSWAQFTADAPRIGAVFTRRHAAAGNLCMLATIRSDGFPRISPMEPRIFEDQLWITGMPNTTKYFDLQRNPKLCLHTATVDTAVADGDAKLWGLARFVAYGGLHERFAAALFDEIGLDLRGQEFDMVGVEITGASAVEVRDDHLDITIWKPGQPERVVRKH
ncbi:pyridoxamine 5'-phosphate oxidase family protein [Mycobacterium vicinigordonae]|uniref:Pyridoxamine 5'-phosphate oxidase family protein n=1 Tax=Mycobacterium vicinigordonae TaxID=1719132 RepID=A0A7D6DZJ8_9MYCO|nr:pyridoxamine 5'-phosphate oxidase family protein [Mycobacterium vicinigordonae]QLL08527.1 pyridoxamine 5'-phosphate oxidase family protein [Mycobacterium vicinigordonae]